MILSEPPSGPGFVDSRVLRTPTTPLSRLPLATKTHRSRTPTTGPSTESHIQPQGGPRLETETTQPSVHCPSPPVSLDPYVVPSTRRPAPGSRSGVLPVPLRAPVSSPASFPSPTGPVSSPMARVPPRDSTHSLRVLSRSLGGTALRLLTTTGRVSGRSRARTRP